MGYLNKIENSTSERDPQASFAQLSCTIPIAGWAKVPTAYILATFLEESQIGPRIRTKIPSAYCVDPRHVRLQARTGDTATTNNFCEGNHEELSIRCARCADDLLKSARRVLRDGRQSVHGSVSFSPARALTAPSNAEISVRLASNA